MKKLMLANAILAIAVIFSFCAKPELKEELSLTTDNVAGDRATCTLVNNPANINTVLTLCGTNTNATICADCVPNKAMGQEVFIGGLFSLNLQTPITFTIRNTNPTAYNLSAGGLPLPPIPVGANNL